jgi:hypothetical protein
VAIKFGDLIRDLEQFQIVDMLIFLLIFTILFAVLSKTRIFGEGKKNINVGVALLFSLVVLFVHFTQYLPPTQDPFEILKKALPQVSLLVVAIISLMILIGVFAHDKIMLGLTAPGWIGFFSIASIVFIFGAAAGWWAPNFMGFLQGIFGEDSIMLVIMILIFGVIIAFITGPDTEGVGTMKRLGIELPKLFGK